MQCFQMLFYFQELIGLASVVNVQRRILLQESTTSLAMDSLHSILGELLSEVGRALVPELARG